MGQNLENVSVDFKKYMIEKKGEREREENKEEGNWRRHQFN